MIDSEILLNWTTYVRMSYDFLGDIYKCQLSRIQCIWNVPVDLIEIDDASDELYDLNRNDKHCNRVYKQCSWWYCHAKFVNSAFKVGAKDPLNLPMNKYI